ncbi:hypothetical protein GASC598B02_005030 [Gilliamella apicola SCGC AB-598-B02]|nr:hypothetical protein GASC598B02_005030 [Gilliamella apicola SCGC AB-598-B02]
MLKNSELDNYHQIIKLILNKIIKINIDIFGIDKKM